MKNKGSVSFIVVLSGVALFFAATFFYYKQDRSSFEEDSLISEYAQTQNSKREEVKTFLDFGGCVPEFAKTEPFYSGRVAPELERGGAYCDANGVLRSSEGREYEFYRSAQCGKGTGPTDEELKEDEASRAAIEAAGKILIELDCGEYNTVPPAAF